MFPFRPLSGIWGASKSCARQSTITWGWRMINLHSIFETDFWPPSLQIFGKLRDVIPKLTFCSLKHCCWRQQAKDADDPCWRFASAFAERIIQRAATVWLYTL